jgi:hypothetical protein
MAEQKPRNVKDLKARLGRTIAPNTKPGAPDSAPASMPSQPPADPFAPAVPKPTGLTPPVAAPSPGVPPPALGRKAMAAPVAAPADPFAVSAAPQVVQEIRFDDTRDGGTREVGRQNRVVVIGLIVAGLAAGTAAAFLAMKMNSENRRWNAGILSVTTVKTEVDGIGETMTKVQGYVNNIAGAAHGTGGDRIATIVQAVDGLGALEKPTVGATITQQDYSRFDEETVNDLFTYYQNVDRLWDRIEVLKARTSGEERRARLTAAAGGNVAQPIACMPLAQQPENQFLCSLLFQFENPSGEAGTVRVGQSPRAVGAQAVEKKRIVSLSDQWDEFAAAPNGFVLGVDPATSTGVLAEPTNEYQELVRLVDEIKRITDETMAIQTRLEGSLGELANLSPRFALGI